MSTTFNAYEIAAETEARGEDALPSVIFQALGAASVCWDDDRVFESEQAKAIGDSVVAYLRSPENTGAGGDQPTGAGEIDLDTIKARAQAPDWRTMAKDKYVGALEDARLDVPFLLAEVRRLRTLLDAAGVSR